MNAADARIAGIYTAQTGATVKDSTPNAGPPRTNTFDLIVQLEAGNVLGQNGEYTLNFTAINENTLQPQANLVPIGNPFPEKFDGVPGGGVGLNWQQNGTDFVRTGAGEAPGILRYRITIPPGLTGRFHYNLEFVTRGFQVVDLAQSDAFLLV
jgi:hypothetical protein